jgi:hypothetical protein
MRSVFAEKVAQGFYVNVEVNRPEAALLSSGPPPSLPSFYFLRLTNS